MKKLYEKKWKDIELGKIADVNSGRDIYAQERTDGDIPYITSGTANNGIGYFVGNDNDSKAKNAISVNRNGAVGEAFYHPYEALYGNDCRRVNLHDAKDEETQLFAAQCISEQKEAFSYSRKLGTARLKRLHVMLPVTDSGKPDYDYMAQYTSEMREGMLMRYKNHVAGQLSHLEYKDIPALDEKEWSEFRLGDLFEVSRPKARNKDDYEVGDIPFVASGAMNNGVMKCCNIKPDEKLDRGNCITVSPVDGSSFYQPMDFLGRGGAGSSVLMLRNNTLNLFRGEFMARMIQQTCSKYNYGHMGNKDSIKRERVMLPVTDSGEPDYEYMEQYSKNVMLRKYQQYLMFLKQRSDTR